MSFVVNEEINLVVDSNPLNGSQNLNSLGSQFEVNFDDRGLNISKDALSIQCSVEEAGVWFNTPNITGENNKFNVSVPNTADVLTNYDLTIPEGLYDLSQLNETIQRELRQLGAKYEPSPAISISADDATQRVVIEFQYPTTGSLVDFTVANNMSVLLGFNEAVYTEATLNPVEGDNVAKLNTVNYYVIHSDIVSQGIRFNNSYNNTIAIVPIDTQPNFQINYKPFNPAKSDASDLAGSKKRKFKFWLTDDQNRLVNTRDEHWNARIRISYQRPYVVEKS